MGFLLDIKLRLTKNILIDENIETLPKTYFSRPLSRWGFFLARTS
ncbi:hypothetical protein AM1_A0117 (plasmid) [Acaryochloris marina MBIC11017]|uniref:Uncharacterized protein n=1 Tax=Acaryochloris marina (strain MBIC 11017) TaxID=329726 RepID=A8ZKC6_ACAM1|nr:hypothetical protein AM1_A0117 [Acaryochloris marina MBIC11017]